MEKEIYRDCQRNHACYFGGYAIDGCKEFIPCNNMKIHCEACGCHRNYHRKVPLIDLEEFASAAKSSFWSLREAKRIARQRYVLPAAPSSSQAADCKLKRRKKTKFSKGQKEAMREFAESLGWTMKNKGRRAEIIRFCEIIGVSRPMFKNWLNNNKKVYVNKKTDSASSGAKSSSSKAA